MFCLKHFSWSTPHSLAQLEMLQAPRHKLPPGPGQACGTHHPSEYHLQAVSGFSPKKPPERQAGHPRPDPGLGDLHLSSPGLPSSSEPDSWASMKPTETPANPTNVPGVPKAVLGLGQGQSRGPAGNAQKNGCRVSAVQHPVT